MKASDWMNMTKEEQLKDIENWMASRPPNGCTCPDCMRSWEKEKEFNKMENKDEYFKQRTENYEVDDLVFDTTRDITRGDTIHWTKNEHKLHDTYREMFGMFSGYSLMRGCEDMGKDVKYKPRKSKEERAANFVVDTKLVLLNAMSDNPKLELMTNGEIKIYEQFRNKQYLNPEDRTERIKTYEDSMKDIFKDLI